MNWKVAAALAAVIVIATIGYALRQTPGSQQSSPSFQEPMLDDASRGSENNQSAMTSRALQGSGSDSPANEGPASMRTAGHSLTMSTFGCDFNDLFDKPIGATNEREFRRTLAATSDALANTDDAEFIVASAFLNPPYDPATGQVRFERALAIAPRNKLVLWNASMQCGHEAGAAYCEDEGFLSNAKEILGGNGAWWLQLAGSRANFGDISGALHALQKTAVEPEFDFLYIDHVFLLERGFAATTAWDYRMRISTATSYAGALPNPEFAVFRFCKDRLDDDLWLDACIKAADRLAVDGRTMLEKSLGYGYLMDWHKTTGDVQAQRAAEAGYFDVQDPISSDINADTLVALYADSGFLARFYDEWAVNGENAAHAFAEKEFARLSEDPNYNPCERAGLESTTRPSTGSDRE